MSKSLPSWPKRHRRLGASLHLTNGQMRALRVHRGDSSAGTSCFKNNLRLTAFSKDDGLRAFPLGFI